MRFWFPPAVVQGLRRLCGGLFFSWHPGLPHPRISPRGWCFARLPQWRCPLPHPGGCAVSTRRWPKRFLYSAATRAGAVFIQACHLQELGRPVRSLGTHRVLHLPLRPYGPNPAFASCWLYRLRVACRGCFVVLCCDGCTVSQLTASSNNFFVSDACAFV